MRIAISSPYHLELRDRAVSRTLLPGQPVEAVRGHLDYLLTRRCTQRQLLLRPDPMLPTNGNAPVNRRERLGGLLDFYHRRAA
jgi:hypothetical protein